MKKIILSAFMVMGLAFSAEAQNLKNAIGLRLGSNDGFGAEVSYQRWLSKKNRLEFDFGWRDSDDYDAIKLIGVYQWVWNIENGFKWYAGPGIGIGSYSTNHDHYYDHNGHYHDHDESGAFLIATGDIGIEYNFDFPLQLSFDLRPEIYFNNDYGDVRGENVVGDFGLSARYRF